jgi:hypothetical protein
MSFIFKTLFLIVTFSFLSTRRRKIEKNQFSQVQLLEIRERVDAMVKQFYSLKNGELTAIIKQKIASMEDVSQQVILNFVEI